MIKFHKLKTQARFFDDINKEIKTFEIRKNDRNFKIGDYIILEKYDHINELFFEQVILLKITYITEFNMKSGYVCMGFKILDRS